MQQSTRSQPSSPQKSPSLSKSESFENLVVPEAPKENVIVRLLVTPITFISFLISLFLIDARNHSLRQHSHTTAAAPSPPTTLLGKLQAFFHHLIFKPTSFSNDSSSPYAYVKSPTGEKVGVVSESEFKVKDVRGEKESDVNQGEKWYWRTKQKKMMRAEVADAFKIRKWVVGFLVLSGTGVLFVGWMVTGWIISILLSLLVGGGSENRLGRDW